MKLNTIINKKLRPKPQVLIIDGEWNMLKLLYSVLSNHYELVVKNSSVDAMRWLENGNSPALIITEYQMPYIDGTLFIRHIKCSGIHNHIPIIILSDTHDVIAKVNRLAFCIGAIIAKPFDPAHLVSKINLLLNEYQSTLA